MTKTKSTKRALIMSVMALFLCFTMLLGTTFAWFTDSVSSGSNVIKAGNLDIAVEYTLDGENWNDLEGADDLFGNLWEPGHTEVVALRIKNNGTLALKYAANMNIVKENIGKTKDGADIVLSDILTVSTLTQQAIDENGNANQIGDITLALAFDGENSVAYQNTTTFKAGNVLGNDVFLEPGAAHYLIVKVDMAETVGNEANHNGTNIPTINFGINVLATQFTYENDSFGNQYDKDATYPELIPTVTDLAGLREAMANGGEYKLGANITVTSADMLTTIHGDGSAFVMNAGEMVLDLNGYDITVNGKNQYSDVFFVTDDAKLTVKGNGNVTADCGLFVVSKANSVINIEGGNYKCTVQNDMLYAIHGKLNVSGGTFETAYWNLINIYGQGNISLVDVSGGSFKNWNPASSPDGNLLADGYKSVSEEVDGVTWYTVVAE